MPETKQKQRQVPKSAQQQEQRQAQKKNPAQKPTQTPVASTSAGADPLSRGILIVERVERMIAAGKTVAEQKEIDRFSLPDLFLLPEKKKERK